MEALHPSFLAAQNAFSETVEDHVTISTFDLSMRRRPSATQPPGSDAVSPEDLA